MHPFYFKAATYSILKAAENQDNFAALYADNIVYSYFTQYKVTFQV